MAEAGIRLRFLGKSPQSLRNHPAGNSVQGVQEAIKD